MYIKNKQNGFVHCYVEKSAEYGYADAQYKLGQYYIRCKTMSEVDKLSIFSIGH